MADSDITISGLVNWWRAQDLTGYSDGDTVQYWPSSTTGFQVKADEVDKRPTYWSNVVGGKAVLRFDGVGDRVWAQVNDVAQPTTWFVVFRSSLAGVTQNILWSGQEVLRTDQDYVGVYAGAVATLTGHTHTDWDILHACLNDAASTYQIDGTDQVASGNCGTQSTGIWFVIGDHDNQGLGRGFKGDIAEVIQYNRALTTAERDAITAHLQAYYSDSTPPPSYTFTQWDGAAEQPLTLAGVWNGTTIDPATPEVV